MVGMTHGNGQRIGFITLWFGFQPEHHLHHLLYLLFFSSTCTDNGFFYGPWGVLTHAKLSIYPGTDGCTSCLTQLERRIHVTIYKNLLNLVSIAFMTVIFGLALDRIYASFGISAQAVVGRAVEIMPVWAEWAGAIFLVFLSVKPISRSVMRLFKTEKEVHRDIDNESDLHEGNADPRTCFEPD